ncbi:hypothetical protein [Deinococcus sp. NW-56]|uniref:hypothetical protein n=1 Tax=Deinococcus sp. NW-56 TaxID=2080419 RepID=UPI000CF5080B|nr:hypothetical protein [Deinococcus sp. NW-56]
MNAPRLLVTMLTGVSAALIAYSAFYVRGDTAGVMRYLRERGDVRDLEAGGASAAAVRAAQDNLSVLALSIADPEFAARMIPVAVLIGLLVGWLVWRSFGSREGQAKRGDVQERMVLKVAYRRGGQFTAEELRRLSPLSEEQVQAVTRRMLEAGQLVRDGDTFRLAR